MPLHRQDFASGIEGSVWLINVGTVSFWILDLEESNETVQATCSEQIWGMGTELDVSNITIVASDGSSTRLEPPEILGSEDNNLTFACPCYSTELIICCNSIVVALVAGLDILELLVLVGGCSLQVVDDVFT